MMGWQRQAVVAGGAAAVLGLALPSEAGIYIDAAWGFPSNDPATLFDEEEANTDFEFDLDTNSALSLAVGWDSWVVRSELELTFRDTEGVLISTDPPSADAGSGSFENISLMTNLYVDLPIPATPVEVFAGGGIGVVMFDGEASGSGDLDMADFDDAGYGFAYQFKVGVAYKIIPNLALTGGYRYWRAAEVDFGAFELEDVEVHSVDVGVRLTF